MLRSSWANLSLAQQFAIISTGLIGIGMGVLGTWVSAKIEDGVVQNTAAARAVYMDSFISPLAQDLASQDTLSADSQQAVLSWLKGTAFGLQVVSIKFWTLDGRIAYSTNPDLIGQSFPLNKRLQKALSGRVVAELDDLNDEEHLGERGHDKPLLEVYSPIRETKSKRIIGVAEFYEKAEALRRESRAARIESWLVVGAVTLAMIGTLFVIVSRGSQTIIDQRESLIGRVRELSILLAENFELQKRLRLSHARMAENNEHFLRRVGADLHDGPAQLVSLALLRLDDVMEQIKLGDLDEAERDFKTIRGALSDSLIEIRSLSAGLAPPELEDVTPAEALRIAARSHERRTKTSVQCDIGEFPKDLPPLLKTCFYRFAQEGLNNAYRHAGGQGQTVRASFKDGDAVVEIIDTGPGIDARNRSSDHKPLGLAGMRDRIESLGGSFELNTRPNFGTIIAARFKLVDAETADA